MTVYPQTMISAVDRHLSYPENRIKYCLHWIEHNNYGVDEKHKTSVYKRLYHWIEETENITYYD